MKTTEKWLTIHALPSMHVLKINVSEENVIKSGVQEKQITDETPLMVHKIYQETVGYMRGTIYFCYDDAPV